MMDWATSIQLALSMWKYGGLVPITIGTFGNMMSIIVFRRKTLRGTSASHHFSFLAVVDILSLHLGLLPAWFKSTLDLDITILNEASCKIMLFLPSYLTDLSIWTLVVFTTERTLTVWFPYSHILRCTKRSRFIMFFMTAVLVFGANAQLLFNLELSTDTRYPNKCNYKTDKNTVHFIRNIWIFIDLSKKCFLPFLIIVVGNVALLVKTHQSRKSLEGSRHSQSTGTSSMTVMLVVTNLQLLVTMAPVMICMLLWTLELVDRSEIPALWVAFNATNVFCYFNNSLNFFTYCLSGKRFRSEFIGLIRENLKPCMRVCGAGTSSDKTGNSGRSTQISTISNGSTKENQQPEMFVSTENVNLKL